MRGTVLADGDAVADRCVSNGIDVVLTDAAGAWDLPDSDQPFVWVHRGAGLDCANWYQRCSDVLDGRAVVFEMVRCSTKRRRFAHITDLHIDVSDGVMGLHRGDCTAAVLSGVFEELRSDLGCDFVVATGDLTNRGTTDDFVEIGAALAAAPLPVYQMPGNHDHYGDFFEKAGDRPAAQQSGRPSGDRYEHELGPRWWSITAGGMRIVAIDWHTWIHGVDDDVQRSWLTADLECAEPGTSVLVLSHDLMSHEFFEQLAVAAPHVEIVGSLSGHWHTARSARVGTQIHVNTGNPMFGSWDWSPPHCRVIEFDGDALNMRTCALGVDEANRSATFAAKHAAMSADSATTVRWRAELAGVTHHGGPSLATGLDGIPLVVAGWRDEDRSVGGITAIRLDDGAEAWTSDSEAGLIAPVTVSGDVVASVTIDGHVALLNSCTGASRWSATLTGHRGLWVCARPLITDEAVVVGSGPAFAGFDLADGRRLWHRADLGNPEMYPNYGDGLVLGSSAIMGMPSVEPSLFRFDAATGETVWATGDATGSSPAGSLAWGDPDRVYGLSHAPELFCVDAATGNELFRVAIERQYTWAAPLVTQFGVVANMGDGFVACFDADDGSEIWRRLLPAAASPAFAPYRQRGPSSMTSPVRAGTDACVVASTDGSVWVIDLASGGVERLALLPAAVTANLAVFDGSVIAPTADGSLWCLRLDSA